MEMNLGYSFFGNFSSVPRLSEVPRCLTEMKEIHLKLFDVLNRQQTAWEMMRYSNKLNNTAKNLLLFSS